MYCGKRTSGRMAMRLRQVRLIPFHAFHEQMSLHEFFQNLLVAKYSSWVFHALVCIPDRSFPGCWHMWYLAVSDEDLSRYLLLRDKPCFVQWQINKSVCCCTQAGLTKNTLDSSYWPVSAHVVYYRNEDSVIYFRREFQHPLLIWLVSNQAKSWKQCMQVRLAHSM